MKNLKKAAAIMAIFAMLTACGTPQNEPNSDLTTPQKNTTGDIVEINLSDDGVKVNGALTQTDPASAVFTANDIVYYESGMDFKYGEGTEKDAHNAEDAAAHTVVHITQPGTYSISGTLSKGQIAVDLGDDAEDDPNAVVTLILNGTDITCEVAPAVIFYNVYECGSSDADNASKDVDTSAAGANVIIADGTTNTINGSYVARIYKPDSVVLNEDGTEVEDAKKLHKYDGAFYSKMSMNVDGESENTGVLNINAENEGLDSELHLTINGGIININSGNDGINTNEDGVSVTTVNGGALTIRVTGETGEGDGIDSNGWLVINDGSVIAAACSNSADAGIDSDMGIHINGGTVTATGHMLDRIEDGGQNYAVFNFTQKQDGSCVVSLKNESGQNLMELCPINDYSVMIYSSPDLTAGSYTLWSDGTQLAGQGGGGMMGRPGMQGMPGMGEMPNMNPDRTTPPDRQEDMEPPMGGQSFEGMEPPEGGQPFENMEPPSGEFPAARQEHPSGSERPEKPDMPNGGEWNPNGGRDPQWNGGAMQESSSEFLISDGANMFANISTLN